MNDAKQLILSVLKGIKETHKCLVIACKTNKQKA